MELGFAIRFCYFVYFTMVKNDIVFVENVNGVDDEVACDVSMNMVVDILDVGSIHLQCDNDLLKNDELQFVAIEIQTQKWRTHNKNLIIWGFFYYQKQPIY